MKILVVDDDGFIRALMQSMLEPEGHCVTLCPGVDAAVEVLSKGQVFDLIITDLLMPQKTGMDFIGYLKRQKIRTPVLAITGGLENAIDDYVNIGELYADATLAKPVSRADLLDTVQRLGTGRSAACALH